MTIGNAKAIDLFVERGRRTANIQLKSISLRKNTGWPMTKSKVWTNVIYVFVCLNPPGKPPTFFIATPSEVRPRVKQYSTRGIPSRRNGLRHAFITFHMAKHTNENLTAAEAGNSPAMLHQHYRGLATLSDAIKWFQVKPPRAKGAENVIHLGKAVAK